MMERTKEPRKICPNELAVLWWVANDNFSSIPKEVIRVAEAIGFVISAQTQTAARSALNRRFSQLRKAHPKMFPAVLNWLNEEHTRELFSRSGGHWAWCKLIASVGQIIQGEKPHVAFGMNKAKGAPPLWGFTKAEDAAMYAQYLHICEGKKITDAKLDASVLFKIEMREIDRTKICMLDANSAKKQATLACIKHKIK